MSDSCDPVGETGKRATAAVPEAGRLLGLDYGTHRVGTAISTYEQNMASPLENYTLRSDRLDADWLAQLAIDYRAVGLVVGLPIHLRSGDEGGKAHEARDFGEWASAVTGLPVVFHDERMTTASAELLLMDAGFTKKQRKARLDKLAAQIMLQSFLDARAKPPAE
ncbi:MAG: Holliday junction resolvase RuvX [Planctomycetaceae bacterium]|nr:Holliday junction resolvase RuvX [Planctomycetaceae bacterium]